VAELEATVCGEEARNRLGVTDYSAAAAEVNAVQSEALRAWAGGDFDSTAFSARQANRELRLRRHRAAPP
jgi:hypothetical protein